MIESEVQENQIGNQKIHCTMSKFIPKTVPLKTFDKVCMVLGELIGTTALVFFGCMSFVPMKGDVIPILPPFLFGLFVMMIIQTFGHVSYAILNPAIAIVAVVNNLISIKVLYQLKCN